jgi:hypothetical protein
MVEGPTDMPEQLRSLKALYLESMEEAAGCRTFFLNPPSTQVTQGSSYGPRGECSMYAGNGTITRGRSPPRHLQELVQNKQIAVNEEAGVDEVERVVEMAVDDARPRVDEVERDVEMAVDDVRPPSDTGDRNGCHRHTHHRNWQTGNHTP